MTDQLLEIIRTADDVVDLVHRLLFLCRNNEAEYRQTRNDSTIVAAEHRLTHEVSDRLGHSSFEDMTEERRARLHEVIDRYAALPDVVAARALALAVDEVCGDRFFPRLRSVHDHVVLRPHDPVPLSRPPLKQLIDRPTSRPESLRASVDRLPHLCLAPQSMGIFEVRLHYDIAEIAAPLGLLNDYTGALGVASLNDGVNAFTWTVEERDGLQYFWDVHPLDAAAQARAMQELLERAGRQKISVLVYPELCASRAEIDALGRSFERTIGHPLLLVAGSSHGVNDGRRVNEARTFLRNLDEPLVHRKFAPFVMRTDNVETTEDIHLESTPRLDVYYTDCWSFAVLICKDFLDRSALNLLEELGVRLVFVPAFTAKTRPFAGFANGLSTAQQAIVIIANNPPDEDGITAIFSVPRSHGSMLSVPAAASLPALQTYRLWDGVTETF